MDIGIVGSGVVAQTLAAGFLKHGHDVMLGTRDSQKLDEFADAHPNVRIGSTAQAADFADIAVLAVKGTAALQAVYEASPYLDGKTVLDTTNPIADVAPVEGVLSLFTGPNDSLLERLQHEFPRPRFVKAFNSVGAGRMVDPDFASGTPTMFIAGDDLAARGVATRLLAGLGWDVADMGPAIAARAIEPLCVLWCIPGFRENSWMHAFKLLR